MERVSTMAGHTPELDAYNQRLKTEVTEVTTEGYDIAARRHMCEGNLTFTDSRSSLSLPVRYTVQGIEAQRGRYQVAYFDTAYPMHLSIMGFASKSMAAERDEPSRAAVPQAAESPSTSPKAEEVATSPPVAEPPASLPALAASTPAPAANPSATVAVVQASAPTTNTIAQVPPSFSCAAKLSAPEQLICSTAVLADADARMTALYTQAIARAADRAGVKRDQLEWRKSRDACTDATCMQASYERRNAELAL